MMMDGDIMEDFQEVVKEIIILVVSLVEISQEISVDLFLCRWSSYYQRRS